MSDIKNHFCNNENCKTLGIRDHGNIVKAGNYTTTKGETKQMLKCNICNKRFSETRNTVFFGSHYSSETIGNIIRCAVEGNGVRSTARILDLSKDSVNKVILKAGEHAHRVLSDLLQSLHLEECQLDELWSFVNKKNSFRRRFRK